jgi:hypothetical protein
LRLPGKKEPKLYQLAQGALYQTCVTRVTLPSAGDAVNVAQRLGYAWARYVANGSPKRLVRVMR